MNLSEVVAEIDAQPQHGNLSSALRLFVLDFYRTQLSHGKEGRVVAVARRRRVIWNQGAVCALPIQRSSWSKL